MDASIPEGAIPVDQFQPEGAIPHQASASPVQQEPEGAIPVDQFESHEDYFGSPGQQIKAGLEGVAQGVAGPLATLAETKLLKVKPEDILAREEENPISHGVGEAAGLVGSALTGVGEAAVMAKAGELTSAAVGLGKAAEGASLGFKVGSSAVQQAAEMAVLQAGDETSHMIMRDPNTTAQTAMANVGLSAALGGAGGAFITGAVSPLWGATVGPKVESALHSLKSHFNGSAIILPEATEAAVKELGITPDAVMRAGMSKNPKAAQVFGELKEAQKPEVLAGIEKMHQDASDAVMKSLRIAPEDVAVHSENETGHDLLDAFKQEYNDKYEPIAAALQKRDAEAAHIPVSDDARLHQFGRMTEQAMEKHSMNSPYYKLYEEYGNRLLDSDTIGKMDKVKTEINNRLRGMTGPGTDYNVKEALTDIKASIANFQEAQIGNAAAKDFGDKSMAKGFLEERAAANADYAKFANLSDELTNHLGVGDFRGAGSLKGKLTDKLSPEQLLNKFSIRGNADFIPFLQQHFPETFERVKENELKRLIKPAVLKAKGENAIDIKKLSDIVDKNMAGKKEYIESILPADALKKIQAARTLVDAIPNPKSSGTAGWLMKLTKHVPANTIAGVSYLTGHGPLGSVIAGGTSHLLHGAPEAIKLAYLKFLASDMPVAGAAFKASIDYIDSVYKGDALLAKAVKNTFKAGAQVLADNQRPSQADRDKLDKQITKIMNNPQELVKLQNGQVGHYFPDHQSALTQTSTQAVQYLQNLKPKPYKPTVLDSAIKPLPAEEARYQRALNIAQQPAVVMEHIKDGTLQASDIQDLHAMYPGVYGQLTQKITDQMANKTSDDELIPYRTRMGMSLFLTTPVDSTMTPASIMAAQPMPKPPISAAQGGAQGKTRKGTTTLGKSNKSYMTQSQSAEADRHDRD